MLRNGLGTWVMLCAALSMAAPAAAQEEGESEARMHFRVGRAYYDSGRFADAAREFEEAYRQSQRPELQYNIFLAYRDAGEMGPATEALRRYLDMVPDAENRDQLTARLAAMERVRDSQGGEPADPETTPAEPEPSPTQATAAASPPVSDGGGGGMWMPGSIIAAVGGAAMIGGIITGVLALDAQGRLESEFMCDANGGCAPGFESTRDEGALLAGLTDGLLIGGAVVLGVGVVLAFVLADSGSSDSADAGSFACGPAGCGVRF